jgi:hypothetical protein
MNSKRQEKNTDFRKFVESQREGSASRFKMVIDSTHQAAYPKLHDRSKSTLPHLVAGFSRLLQERSDLSTSFLASSKDRGLLQTEG